ncbi:MAG: AAA family ATPase [Flavobacteriales bacterium]|nr:AAA family ATPase [Flavobacteriales bacterium]
MEKQNIINPFPGLRPFQKHESGLFFGRENHVGEILRKLSTFRFVSIVGNSGSGKSSLVRAGVLPKIEQSEQDNWLVATMRPGKNPVDELVECLFKKELFGSENPERNKSLIDENIKIVNANKLGLVQLIRTHLKPDTKLLILVDQFEELFRFQNSLNNEQNTQADHHFVDLLLGAVSQKEVPVYIIMTIRSDFLGDCEQFSGLPEAINDGQFLIPRMNREELQRSITGPIDLVNGKISPQLVYRLLNEIGNSNDQLPVLQHALMRTWEVWMDENEPNKPIDIETYEKTGGLSKALSNHAEEAFSELKTDEKKKVTEAFFKTITLKGPDNRGIRRPTLFRDILKITGADENILREVINTFRRSDRGFIMPPESVELKENSIIDLSHESLMRIWERLSNWVNEEAESAEIYIRICESALLYDKNMAGLWRDPDLQIALDWKSKNNPNSEWAVRYDENFDLAIRFIEASKQDKKFMIAERNRRKQLTRIVLTLFLIALSGLTVWAYLESKKSESSAQKALVEKQNALEQEKIAKEQKLAAEANFIKAEEETKKAEIEKQKAEEQRKIAIKNSLEAELQRSKAERASISANEARKAAELDKKIAQLQRQLSDSLKTVADNSKENAFRLRVLSISQTMAIKSTQAQINSYEKNVKHLLALQANKFNEDYKGNPNDPEILNSLFSSYRAFQNRNEYIHNHHLDAVRSLAFSHDDKKIASSGADGKMIVINKSDLSKTITNYPQLQSIVENIGFSPDDSKIFASSDENRILIYDMNETSNKPNKINIVHKDKISSLNWEGNLMVSTSFDLFVRIIDPIKSTLIKEVQLVSKPLCSKMLLNKQKLLIGCEDGNVYQLDLKEPYQAKLLKKCNSDRITCIDYLAGKDLVATGSSSGKLIVFELGQTDHEIMNLSAHNAIMTSVKFNLTNQSVATSSYDGLIKVWNTRLKDDQPLVYSEHESWVWGVSFSNDGKYLISGGRDKSVHLYPVDRKLMVAKIENNVSRNFTQNEWINFIGADIPYEKTITGIK